MTQINFASASQQISAELFAPSSGTNWPAVVVAYGTVAMQSPFDKLISAFCVELSRNGIVAVLPDYMSSTGTTPGFDTVYDSQGLTQRFDRWVAVLQDCVKYTQTIPGVAAGLTGFVGFSLGGHLVLRAALHQSVKVVVDYFGFLSWPGSSVTKADAATLPAVQIHHGEADRIVDYQSNGPILDGWLTSASVVHEFNHYPSNGHPGQETLFPPGPGWNAQAAATPKTISFLQRYI